MLKNPVQFPSKCMNLLQMQEKIEAQHREKQQNIYNLYDNYCMGLDGGGKMQRIEENDGDFISYL